MITSKFLPIVLVSLFAVSNVGIAAVSRVPVSIGPSGQTVTIPSQAVEVASNVFDLGTAIDPVDGKVVQGYAIVRKVRGEARGGGKPGGATACYGFFARGAKWKTAETWVVNPSNPDGINEGTIFSLMAGGINKWEDATDGIIGNSVGKNIFNDGTTTNTMLVADETAPDTFNEIYFAPISDSGTIGVTIVWGIFGGPERNRELREWDQVYNTDYTWAIDGSIDKMDFDNIATHELGHSAGLTDLYTASCSAETMYGYGTEGETKKRDLGPGDIAGIKELYR